MTEPRKPTKEEIQEIIDFHWYDFDSDDDRERAPELLERSSIAVFDKSSQYPEKIMFVALEGVPQNTKVYTWKDGWLISAEDADKL